MKNFVVWAILLFTITFFGACDMPQNLPVRFYVDNSVDNGREYISVVSAANQWNSQAGSLLDPPQTIIEIVGVNLTTGNADMDGVHVVYYPETTPKKIEDSPAVNKEILGVYWNTAETKFVDGSEDIYILYDRIERFRQKYNSEYSEDPEFSDWHIMMLHRITLHEFGHALGIRGHVKDEDSIMKGGVSGTVNELREADLARFCQIYSCR